ncbi:MAG: biopolymer transporter ExbD [Methylibium sp.]|uniref:ExbD/TolR family protein n=1 Tax=Methylibium sp. TaxID=2067992 RepID=UPI001824A6E5|nr:biopolymer transporter ExbD [Methylibium sp.]MBA3596522.1 biopolymer transporter ExbD [Methylibium sp.]
MAMNVSSGNSADGEPEVMMDINTTPLIDVMLVLLIMLIITIPIQLHAVNLALPAGNPPPPPLVQPQVVKVDIDASSRVFWNGEVLAGPVEVDARLRELAALPLETQPELHLRPDRGARYETVASVMAGVQRLGLTKFGIVGSEQFAP